MEKEENNYKNLRKIENLVELLLAQTYCVSVSQYIAYSITVVNDVMMSQRCTFRIASGTLQ